MTQNTIRTTCSYCSVGCNFEAKVEDKVVKSFLPAQGYPVNMGKSCPKGFHLLTPFGAADRLTTPMVRTSDGTHEAVGWDRALEIFVDRFKDIMQRHGPESVAFLSTGQFPMEEMAFLGALAKFGMGFVHGDGNTRQCMATAAVAYKQAFGFDAPPFTYEDLEESDLLVFIGANPVVAHPVLWNRVKLNRKDARIIVIDPRRTKTAEAADVHLPLRPKSDLSLLYGVGRILIENGWIDRTFIDASTEGFETFARHVADFTPERVSADTSLPAEEVHALARDIHSASAVSMWWTMGVNQSHQAVRTAQAIIDLCLITGNIGKPGTGPNSITGQANAMGSRLFSNTTSLFAGYDFENPGHREKVAELLSIDAARIPDRNSMPYHRILQAVEKGTMKGLWIIATNPMHSWINREWLHRVLPRLEFLVVQDLYHSTETAREADLLLPAAGSGEKDGTFINSERRIGIVRKIGDPPGQARSDFEIFRMIAERWGCSDMFRQWSSPEAVFGILQRVSRGRPCDITGIRGYRMLEERGGVQWPYPEDASDDRVHRRLFEDGRFFTASGKAKLLVDPVAELPEELWQEYPYVLLTGRGTVVQWHTQTRTGKVDMLNKLRPDHCYVEINSADADHTGVRDRTRVEVASRRGAVVVEARVTEEVQPGHLFMPMHYEETNRLTYPAFDPYSFEPAYKYAAVIVRPHGE